MLETLSARFDETVRAAGLPVLTRPLFYAAPAGIRFETGDPALDGGAYLSSAFERIKAILGTLSPDILRIDAYPGELLPLRRMSLPAPHEHRHSESVDGDPMLELYWDLMRFDFRLGRLLRQIVRSDFGGFGALASGVFFVDTRRAILFHPYDDRGADLIASEPERIRPQFDQFHPWILSHDLDAIERVFQKGIAYEPHRNRAH